MTPTYTTPDDSIRLVNQDAGEFLRGLPDGSVDLTLFSPPFNQGARDPKPYGYRARRRYDSWTERKSKEWYLDAMPEDRYRSWLRGIMRECLRVTAGMVVINLKVRGADTHSIHPITLLHPFRKQFWREVIWDRMGSLSMNSRGHATSHEAFYCFRTASGHWSQREASKLTVWHIKEADDVWQLSPERSSEHVCPWPLEIPIRFIRAYAPKGGLVCDPFAGRGTTAWACLATERRFIGAELSPHTFKTACKLTQAEYERNEPEMFSRHEPMNLIA